MPSLSLMRSIGKFISTRVGIFPKSSTAATTNGTGIDRQGFLSCELHASCGAATGTPSTQTVSTKLQDSADNSTFADVSGATVADLTADNAQARKEIDLSGVRRYIRVVQTVAFTGGTSPAIPIAAVVVLGGADTHPVA